jgi:hypothetical protein
MMIASPVEYLVSIRASQSRVHLTYGVITGSTAFVALGGYTYFAGMKNLRQQRKAIERSKSRYKYGSRQLGILSLSATLVGLGLYRTFN